MRKLFLFIVRYHFFFLFVLLEGLAFSFIVRNHYHHAVAINATADFTGKITGISHDIAYYFHLRQVNDQLIKENRELKQILYNKKTLFEPNIPLDTGQQYSLIPVKVLSSNISRKKNYILIDKGSEDQLKKDMGVITTEGIVGIIIETSDNYSLVMSLINIQSSISVEIKRLKQKGSLIWNGDNYRMATLTDIPNHVKLSVGDTIITSGYSHIFPGGLPVGTIAGNIDENKDKFIDADVKLAVDFNRLHYAFVVSNHHMNEIKHLTGQHE